MSELTQEQEQILRTADCGCWIARERIGDTAEGGIRHFVVFCEQHDAEAALAAKERLAKPALGGKQQQYRAKQALATLNVEKSGG